MNTQHPLQSVFNMADTEMDIEKEYGLTEYTSPTTPTVPTEAPTDHKDDDDLLVEKKLDAIYDMAIETFNNQTSMTEIVDPRYAARNAEVAANYLNIALQAAASRAKVKTDRRRIAQAFIPYNASSKTTNNLIVADRNQILKMMIDDEKKELK